MDNDKNRSRREFIKDTAKKVAVIGALPLIGTQVFSSERAHAAAASSAASSAAEKAKVALVISKKPVPVGRDAKAVLSDMLDAGIEYIAGGDTVRFWNKLFSPDDRVAIKINNLAYKRNRGPMLTEAVCDRVSAAGVVPGNIVIYEHSDGSLKHAGYKLNFDGPGVRCYGTDRVGYMAESIKSGACDAHYTKILDQCTALINMPILKAHTMAGVTISLKNHYGSFDNPRQYHGNDCDPFIADINTADIIRKKHRLVVCDAVKVLFAGGPDWLQPYTSDFNGILVSTDPVALDAVGARILKKLRRKSGIKQLPYNPKPKQIATAAKNGIGISDIKKIDFKQITV